MAAHKPATWPTAGRPLATASNTDKAKWNNNNKPLLRPTRNGQSLGLDTGGWWLVAGGWRRRRSISSAANGRPTIQIGQQSKSPVVFSGRPSSGRETGNWQVETVDCGLWTVDCGGYRVHVKGKRRKVRGERQSLLPVGACSGW